MYRNGAGALLSLTFDDGLRCQLENAVPALNARDLRATFFLVASDRSEFGEFNTHAWRDVALRKHEIGSHGVNHRKAASLSLPEAMLETTNSKNWLSARLSPDTMVTPVTSFCYPFTDAPGMLQDCVRRAGYGQARGGRVARPDKFYEPGDGANLHNVTCFHVGPETIKDQQEWIRTAVRRGAWVTLMLHGVGERGAWDNLSMDQFNGLLDALVDARPEGLATVPFAEGAELYRQGRKF